jgi:hypothetical protein
MYKITYGSTRTGRAKIARYATLKDATDCASAIFAATGIVVAIEPVSRPYPGYRTMTAAQRRNARMDRIFDDAKARGDWPR